MKKATVVGCGIIGLTSALALQERGWQVRVVANEKFDKTLSHKVGAIWFPFEVHPREAALRWGALAYQKYLSEAERTQGVSFLPFTVVSTKNGDHSWTKQLPLGSVREAQPDELPLNAELAHVALVPLAEPPIYLPELFDRFIENGGTFSQKDVSTLEALSSLDSVVINCTGLGAKTLCNDELLVPMRGQILRTEKMDLASCVNSTKAGALSYIIKRSTDCILGGTDYLNDWNEAIDPADSERILTRFHEMGFSQKAPIILEEVVGLRPRRTEVRFEKDENFPNVFHNYGHGGAGFTVGWGCALELAEWLSQE